MVNNKKRYAAIKKHDPHFEREKQKYANPIASREFILEYLEKAKQPVGIFELIEAFVLIDDPDRCEALKRRLYAMIRDGQIIQNRKGFYALIGEMDLVKGRVATRRDGSGFVVPDDGGKDIILTAREMRMLFPDDRVLVCITDEEKKRRYGKVVEILQHNITQVAGYYAEENGVGFVVPTSKVIAQEVIIPPENKGEAKIGQLVVAKIISYPTKFCGAVGKIEETLGDRRGGSVEIDLAIRSYGLPHKWSEKVTDEVARMSASTTISVAERARREDLCHLPFVTIDGEDARDFDDAVYCEPVLKKGGWTLYVAIADVSHYVSEKSLLNEEALARGNSVYFPQCAIHMLPELLSCELCSLKPNVERLAIVCKMRISKEGKIANYSFSEAIINSHARLTYNLVHAILEGKDNSRPHELPHLQELQRLYKILIEQRKLRGALEFDRVETKILFDKNQRIKNIVPVKQNYVNGIIEECMLAANVCASNFLLKNKIPALYRIHEGPSTEKLQTLRNFLKNLGLKLGGGKTPETLDYAKLLRSIDGRKDELLIQTLLLRSLSQAVYAAENIGHFGLAYQAYAHFTSPIRRYPDLLNHRAIRYVLTGKKIAEFFYNKLDMQRFGEHCSITERRADNAANEVVDWLKCQFMQDKIGEVCDGLVVGVTEFGLFVELKDFYVEGLLHVTALPGDYYQFDSLSYSLRGKRTNRTYRLGDNVRVKIARVDLDERQIEFALP